MSEENLPWLEYIEKEKDASIPDEKDGELNWLNETDTLSLGRGKDDSGTLKDQDYIDTLNAAATYAPLLMGMGALSSLATRSLAPTVGRGLSSLYSNIAPKIFSPQALQTGKNLAQVMFGQEGIPLSQSVAQQVIPAAVGGGATTALTGSPIEGARTAAETFLTPNVTGNFSRVVKNIPVNIGVGATTSALSKFAQTRKLPSYDEAFNEGMVNAAFNVPGDYIGRLTATKTKITPTERKILELTENKQALKTLEEWGDTIDELRANKSPTVPINDLFEGSKEFISEEEAKTLKKLIKSGNFEEAKEYISTVKKDYTKQIPPIFNVPELKEPYLSQVERSLGKPFEKAVRDKSIKHHINLGEIKQDIDRVASEEAVKDRVRNFLLDKELQSDEIEEILSNKDFQQFFPQKFKEDEIIKDIGKDLTDKIPTKQESIEKFKVEAEKALEDYKKTRDDIFSERNKIFSEIKNKELESLETIEYNTPLAENINRIYAQKGKPNLINPEGETTVFGNFIDAKEIIGPNSSFFKNLAKGERDEVNKLIEEINNRIEGYRNTETDIGEFLKVDSVARTKSKGFDIKEKRLIAAIKPFVSKFVDQQKFGNASISARKALAQSLKEEEGFVLKQAISDNAVRDIYASPESMLYDKYGKRIKDEYNPEYIQKQLDNLKGKGQITEDTYKREADKLLPFLTPSAKLKRQVRIENSFNPIIDSILSNDNTYAGIKTLEEIFSENSEISDEILRRAARKIVTDPDNFKNNVLEYDKVINKLDKLINPEGIGDTRPKYIYGMTDEFGGNFKNVDPITDFKDLLTSKKDITESQFGSIKNLIELMGEKDVNVSSIIDNINWTNDPVKAANFRDSILKLKDGEEIKNSLQAFLLSKHLIDKTSLSLKKLIDITSPNIAEKTMSIDSLKEFVDDDYKKALDKIENLGIVLNREINDIPSKSLSRQLFVTRQALSSVPSTTRSAIVSFLGLLNMNPEILGKWLVKGNGLDFFAKQMVQEVLRPIKNLTRGEKK